MRQVPKKKGSSPWLIGCIVVAGIAGVLLVLGLGAAYFLLAPASEALPMGRTPVFVNITMPVNGSSLPVGQPASVYVQAVGQEPISKIELVVDGVKLGGGTSTPSGGNKMVGNWSWTPGTEGEHTLVAQAMSEGGRKGTGNPVRVRVVPADQLAQAAGSGEAPGQVTDEMTDSETGEDAVIPPPEGAGESAPPAVPEGPEVVEPGAGEPGSSIFPANLLFWLMHILPLDPPEAPVIMATVEGCETTLLIKDNSTWEAGFFLYRVGPGMLFFERVATLDARTGKGVFSYHDPGLKTGNYLYYLSAFNSKGETPGNIVAANVTSPSCVAAEPEGFSFSKLKITPNTPVDKLYCYVSANGSPWTRVPPGQNNFIFPVGGKYDLAPYMGALPGPEPPETTWTMDIECWGWSGGSLVYLGETHETWDPTASLVWDLIGSWGLFEGLLGGFGSPPISVDTLSPPYNLAYTGDPALCETHAGGFMGVLGCHLQLMARGQMLVWDWDRYYGCDPATEPCDMSLQMADGYVVYRLRKGDVNWVALDHVSYLGQTYYAVPMQKDDIYFVRAYKGATDESADSSHITYPGTAGMVTISPSAVQAVKYVVKNDGTPPYWAVNSAPGAGALDSGYGFICIGDCSLANYRDNWYYGSATFELPPGVDVTHAVLRWNHVGYYTSGAGMADAANSCGVSLASQISGPSLNGGTSLWGLNNWDVTDPVIVAQLSDQTTVKFWFSGPAGRVPGERWDRCQWRIKDLALDLYFYGD